MTGGYQYICSANELRSIYDSQLLENTVANITLLNINAVFNFCLIVWLCYSLQVNGLMIMRMMLTIGVNDISFQNLLKQVTTHIKAIFNAKFLKWSL